MKPLRHQTLRRTGANAPEHASVLVVVLWIVFGLIAITLYFAHSMAVELRSSDNRAAGVEADEAVEGARRYYICMLTNVNVMGALPDPTVYLREAVPIGNAHFWLIGRNSDETNVSLSMPPTFGLVDEASKINLNMSNDVVLSNMLLNLPILNLTPDTVANVLAWRSTNTTVTIGGGAQSDTYARMNPPYSAKNGPFETVNELRLVSGIDMTLLYGEDANLNGILDPNENDGDILPPTDNQDGILNPGLLEYVTVYSREPTTYTNTGAVASTTASNLTRVNITGTPNTTALLGVLTTNGIASSRAQQIISSLGGATMTSPLQFFIRSQMTADEVAAVESGVVGSNTVGLINVNTASATVLACVPGLTNGQAAQLVTYRQSITNTLNGSIYWVTQSGVSQQDLITAGPWLTGRGYQYTLDIAALGHDGRGYRRTKYVVDISQGSPVILYRQDLSDLGWALGKDVRDKWLLAKQTP